MARRLATKRTPPVKRGRKAAAPAAATRKRPAKAAKAAKTTGKAKARAKKVPIRKAAPAKRRAKPAPKPTPRKVAPKARAKAVKKAVKKTVKKTVKKAVKPSAPKPPAVPAPKVLAPKSPPQRTTKRATTTALSAPVRKRPALDRERRTVGEPSPTSLPSSLVPHQHASAAGTGADEMRLKRAHYTSAGAALTAGDVDASWESAESAGEGAPGGENPTPDQNEVESIGAALGVQYDDDEELRGGDEIADRNHDRWELDPASSDDFDDR